MTALHLWSPCDYISNENNQQITPSKFLKGHRLRGTWYVHLFVAASKDILKSSLVGCIKSAYLGKEHSGDLRASLEKQFFFVLFQNSDIDLQQPKVIQSYSVKNNKEDILETNKLRLSLSNFLAEDQVFWDLNG